MKSGNFNYLEPSGPLQACNGTAVALNLISWESVLNDFNFLIIYISEFSFCSIENRIFLNYND